MSASVNDDLPPASTSYPVQNAIKPVSVSEGHYKGFVAGIFSGLAKLSGMLPPCHCDALAPLY